MKSAICGRLLIAAGLCLTLAACGPSDEELSQAVGARPGQISDVSCSQASGKPGYVCSFTDTYTGSVLTRRVVKAGGGWQAAY